MKITIQKYLKPTDPEKISNLFSGNCTFEDEIIFEKVLINALPNFKQEYYYQDDILFLKASEFELKISTLIEEISYKGKNIYDFFNKIEPSTQGREKYFILVELTPLNKPAGIIQIDTIEASEINTIISLSVTGIEKEITDWLDSIFIKRPPSEVNMGEFEGLFLTYLFEDLNPIFIKLFYGSDLDLETRTWSKVYVNGFFIDYLWVGGLNKGYSVLSALKSFMVTWGFRLMFRFTGWYGNFPRFEIRFKWRSDFINDLGTIDKFIAYKKSLMIKEQPKFIFVQTGRMTEGSAEYFIGGLFDKYTLWDRDIMPGTSGTARGRIGYLKEYTTGTGTYLSGPLPVFAVVTPSGLRFFPAEDVEIINPGFHAQNYVSWGTLNVDVAFARTAYWGDWQESYYQILNWTSRQEYKYLLAGLAAYRKLEIDISEIDINVSSKAIIDGKNFICEKINNYNDFKKTAECEFREI